MITTVPSPCSGAAGVAAAFPTPPASTASVSIAQLYAECSLGAINHLPGSAASSAPFFAAELDPRPPALIRFVDTHRGRFGVEPICRILALAPSTYYAAKRRPTAARSVRDAELTAEIQRIHQANYGVYGARKVGHQLRCKGIPVARCTLERLMRAAGLAGAVRGRKVRTTEPGKVCRRAGDLVSRDFHAPGPDRLWAADFTYVPCWAGTVYVAFCVDAFSRRILGWKASTSRHTSLVLDVLEQALLQRGYRPNDQVTGLASVRNRRRKLCGAKVRGWPVESVRPTKASVSPSAPTPSRCPHH
ncbi:IS3 family transposase [Streptomyces sp. NPDC001601]|uniref:IS3 family transposase n=1 Tax=Streptomyces sp. NPDC001601 TaxID=3364592 RepID=UPI003684C99D